jgi:hypothetical protein
MAPKPVAAPTSMPRFAFMLSIRIRNIMASPTVVFNEVRWKFFINCFRNSSLVLFCWQQAF